MCRKGLCLFVNIPSKRLSIRRNALIKEGRHSGAGLKFLRILDPFRNPLGLEPFASKGKIWCKVRGREFREIDVARRVTLRALVCLKKLSAGCQVLGFFGSR